MLILKSNNLSIFYKRKYLIVGGFYLFSLKLYLQQGHSQFTEQTYRSLYMEIMVANKQRLELDSGQTVFEHGEYILRVLFCFVWGRGYI